MKKIFRTILLACFAFSEVSLFAGESLSEQLRSRFNAFTETFTLTPHHSSSKGKKSRGRRGRKGRRGRRGHRGHRR